MPSKRSARTGTAISAAPVGVGARRSATKSIRVVSVSCPTAEMTGMVLSATARTTASSLKPHRSSSEPPPRQTIRTSGRGTEPPAGKALNPRTALAMSGAAFSPCTATGHKITWRGKRSLTRCRISRITAPVGDVTTPMTRGKNGMGSLRSWSKRPSSIKRLRRSSSSFSRAPSPASSIDSITT